MRVFVARSLLGNGHRDRGDGPIARANSTDPRRAQGKGQAPRRDDGVGERPPLDGHRRVPALREATRYGRAVRQPRCALRFPPEQIPRWPNHNGSPQSGDAPQVGDPGGAIGEIKSVTTTFSMPMWSAGDVEECTFIGTEGIARATRQGFELARFIDVATMLVRPLMIDTKDGTTSYEYSWLNALNGTMLKSYSRPFGQAAQKAWVLHSVDRFLAEINRAGIRFWAGQFGHITLSADRVDVQQVGRADTVKPADITLSLEDGGFDLVLTADAFYEARYVYGEIPNGPMLVACLLHMGAKPPK